MKIITKELTPERWKDFELLFGDKGACGGCWCMSWRVAKGEKWDDIKGKKAKSKQKKLVKDNKSFGILSYINGETIGWVSYGPRKDYLKLDRAPSLKCDDAEKVWSIPCFFIKKEFRNKGVGSELLKAAIKGIKKRKGKIIEGYPSKLKKDQKLPDAFVWTGIPSIFKKAGFTIVGNKNGGKQRVRLSSQ